jgi:hypothetical protein
MIESWCTGRSTKDNKKNKKKKKTEFYEGKGLEI